MTRVGPIALTCLSLTVFTACGGKSDASDWLGRAESAHGEADRRLARGDVDGARDALRKAVDAAPPKAANPEDARIVRQDLYSHLATLETGQNRLHEAAAWASTGLALGHGVNVFTANLFITRGHAFEQLGDARGASKDYHDALLVTEALLDRSLEGSGGDHD